MPACDRASSITRSCAGPLGTVGPALAPFWLTAAPRITAQIRSPSASASLEPFQDHHSAALASNEAIGRGIEGAAAPLVRQHSQSRHFTRQSRREDGVHTADQGNVDFALPQARSSLLDRDQRSRAVEQHGYCRSHEAELERNAADHRAGWPCRDS